MSGDVLTTIEGVSMVMVLLLYNHPTLCFWRVVALSLVPLS